MISVAEAENLLLKLLLTCTKNTELLMQQPNMPTSKLSSNSNVLLEPDRNQDHAQEGLKLSSRPPFLIKLRHLALMLILLVTDRMDSITQHMLLKINLIKERLLLATI